MTGWILFKRKSETTPGWGSYAVNRLMDVAPSRNISLKVISPDNFDLIITREKKTTWINQQVEKIPDFVITRVGSGASYFSLAIIRHLERLGVHTFNCSKGIDIVRDKLYAQQVLVQSNLPVPKTILVKFPVNIDLVERYLGFPVIVKTVFGSKGAGVFLSEDRRSFVDLMQLLEATKPNVNIILQETITTSLGKDLRVFVVGGKIIGCMQRTSKTDSFKANFSAGADVEAYPINSEIEWLARQSARTLSLDIAGIDLLFDGEHFKICEVNASPGFNGLEQANPGLNVPNEIFDYISLRLGEFD
ncbi:MAG: RimK family alpha-L-glutamate ligase [Candidatus Lokiarchaeota archaeon]|nr:RimK family alpha-L-glutamate ligase [Candidatus Lokiarchaeota archaeon]